MLNYATIQSKPEVTIVKDGVSTTMKDLTTKSIKDFDNVSSNIFVVNKYCVARPDLVSLVIYGSDKYGDLICKFNGISNPFELNEGMIIQCPELSEMLEKLYVVNNPNILVSPESKLNSNGINDNVFKEFTTSMLANDRIKHNTNSTNVKDEPVSTIGITDLKNGKKLKNEKRSPGEQTIDESNYIINKSLGIVIY